MTYDNWKTHDPADDWLGPEPPPCAHGDFAAGDLGTCRHCGAKRQQFCRWGEPEEPDPDLLRDQRNDDRLWEALDD